RCRWSQHLGLNVMSYAKSIGHDRECRVYAAACGKERAIDDIEIFHVMRPVRRVQNALLRILPKNGCAANMTQRLAIGGSENRNGRKPRKSAQNFPSKGDAARGIRGWKPIQNPGTRTRDFDAVIL